MPAGNTQIPCREACSRSHGPWAVRQGWWRAQMAMCVCVCVCVCVLGTLRSYASACALAQLPSQEPEPYNVSRLLVSFTNSSIDALDLLPPVLKPYVTRLLLQTSRIQVRLQARGAGP